MFHLFTSFNLVMYNNPKNQKIENMKTTPEHISILHLCTTIIRHDAWHT